MVFQEANDATGVGALRLGTGAMDLEEQPRLASGDGLLHALQDVELDALDVDLHEIWLWKRGVDDFLIERVHRHGEDLDVYALGSERALDVLARAGSAR